MELGADWPGWRSECQAAKLKVIVQHEAEPLPTFARRVEEASRGADVPRCVLFCCNGRGDEPAQSVRSRLARVLAKQLFRGQGRKIVLLNPRQAREDGSRSLRKLVADLRSELGPEGLGVALDVGLARPEPSENVRRVA
jgi:hypothetical protein